MTLVTSGGERAVFVDGVAIACYQSGDKASEDAAIALLATAGAATHLELAEALGRHRNTVARLRQRMELGGIAAVVPAKRGPKGPWKLTPELRELLATNAGLPLDRLRTLVQESGFELSRSHLHKLQRQLRQEQHGFAEPLELGATASAAESQVELGQLEGESLGGISSGESMAAPDVEVHEQDETATFDPPAVVPEVARGRYMGTSLYYPALETLGLLESARKCFRLPNSELFGVRAVMLTLFFLTLLSKTTVEAAKHLRRFEFGPVVGTGRAPAVKTLRRKLGQLVKQKQATVFQELLAKRWVEQAVVATAYLYVDGHMKAYSGKRKLAECWNSKKKIPEPGVLTHFVNDLHGRPLLFVTEEANVTLAKAMPRVVREIRRVLGDRHFTVIFDRGGYDGELFTWLVKEKIDFITYQQGDPNLPVDRFRRHEVRFEGKRVRFSLCEDEVKVSGGGPWRRIVVRTRTGHQTPILTSIRDLPPAKVAILMFARWRQENFFKYMCEHLGLDQLLGYSWEEADGSRQVPNPQRKELDVKIQVLRKQLGHLRAELGQALLDEPRDSSRSAHGLKTAQRGGVKKIRELETELARLLEQRHRLPTHVPLETVGHRDVMKLEQKAILDRVKLTAYNAEEWLLERLAPHYQNTDDIRQLLRSFAELSGEIRTTAQGVTITLDPPDTPLHRRALRGLCADLSQLHPTYPGTDLAVTYQVAMHHSERAA